MGFISKFQFEPAEWLPFRDREVIDRVAMENLADHQGKVYEHPEFEMKVVNDVHNYFASDLFCRIRVAATKGKKLVVISDGKVPVCKAGDPGSIPGLGRSPGEGNGSPLQYSCLENPMDLEPGRLPSMGSQRVGHD